MKYNEIVSEINISIAKLKKSNSLHSFFIGISNDDENRTSKSHRIKGTDWFIQLPVDSLEIAEDVVCYFGMIGMNTSRETFKPLDSNKLWIYCYEISMHSIE